MLTLPNRMKGVSLIEILIGMTIVSILFFLAVPGFTAFFRNTKLRNAAESIQDGLTLARVEAVRRNAPVQFVLGAGTSWTVECVTAVADVDPPLDGLPDCPGRLPAATNPAFIQARSAAEGSANVIVTSSPAAATSIAFNGLGRALPASIPVGGSVSFDISNPAEGTCAASGGALRCLRVVVTAAGQVRMCDSKLPSTDPQGC